MTERKVSSERVSGELRDAIAAIIAGNVDESRFYNAPAFQRAATEVILALRSSVKTVEVKPLEWSSVPPYSVARVTALRLFYSTEAVWEDGVFQHVELRGGIASGDFPTVSEAKAAAQADYEQRILSAIEAPAAEGEVTDAMVDAAHEAIEQSYRTESWEFGPPSSLVRSILTAALKGDRS